MTGRGRFAALAVASGLVSAGASAETVIVKNATIWTQGPQGRIAAADLLVREGKIVKSARASTHRPARP